MRDILEVFGTKTPAGIRFLPFCQAEDRPARRSLVTRAADHQLNPIFAAFMPCRIAMVEDKKGRIWLMTFNLDMFIDNNMLTPAEGEIAIRVNQNMLKVLVAGAMSKS